MGYTHYWYRPQELDKTAFYKWASDVHHLLENLPATTDTAGGFHANDPLEIRGEGGTGLPVINLEHVVFNGNRDRGLNHETFVMARTYQPESWEREDEQGNYGYFCKTERKPYDLLVTAALIRLEHHFGKAVVIASDGWPEDWSSGLALCKQLFGEAKLPKGIEPRKRPVS